MPSLVGLAKVCGLAALLCGQAAAGVVDNRGSRPFYAIAHRVRTPSGVAAAAKHGANALEIDVMGSKEDKLNTKIPSKARRKGWWGQHGMPSLKLVEDKPEHSAEELFKAVAAARKAGANFVFVWLDIKTLNECDAAKADERHCSIEALRDMTRQILQPAGVKVLYGFGTQNAGTKDWKTIAAGLNELESMNADGTAAQAIKAFQDGNVPREKRIYSSGFFSYKSAWLFIMINSSKAIASGQFSQVFAWTYTAGGIFGDQIRALMQTNVDGVIYGSGDAGYEDDSTCSNSMASIKQWIEAHPKLRNLAAP